MSLGIPPCSCLSCYIERYCWVLRELRSPSHHGMSSCNRRHIAPRMWSRCGILVRSRCRRVHYNPWYRGRWTRTEHRRSFRTSPSGSIPDCRRRHCTEGSNPGWFRMRNTGLRCNPAKSASHNRALLQQPPGAAVGRQGHSLAAESWIFCGALSPRLTLVGETPAKYRCLFSLHQSNGPSTGCDGPFT